MRTAKRITDSFEKQRRETTGLGTLEQQLQITVFVLELLIDIRELLQALRPPTIITSQPEVQINADERLHSQNHQHP